jgi:hypothetical protein
MITLEVTPGELLDRLTILEIKLRHRPADDGQSRLVARALCEAREAWQTARIHPAGLEPHLQELRAINAALWNAEDEIRARERQEDFGEGFVSIARAICRLNDRRSLIKRTIDDLCGSPAWEAKSYGAPPPD